MKYPDNIKELCKLPINMMGILFYTQSPRYIGEKSFPELKSISSGIQLTGVFVNEPVENILNRIKEFDLDVVQLHGNESPVECKLLRQNNVKVIKAFSIKDPEDFRSSVFYENTCDYFLFDTKTVFYGGSGKKFDWQILSYYTGTTPFLLSGGISEQDVSDIKKIDHSLFAGIDLNSKFELSPGNKDINKIKHFISNFTS